MWKGSTNPRERYEKIKEWLKDICDRYYRDISDIKDWRTLKNAAILRKHTGDLDGAIEAMTMAIGLIRNVPSLAETTCSMLNYLAAELFECKAEYDRAEEAIREALGISANLSSIIHGDNLLILARVQFAKGHFGEALVSAEQAREAYQKRGNFHGVGQAEALIETIRARIQDQT